jgi:hypothetical protein
MHKCRCHADWFFIFATYGYCMKLSVAGSQQIMPIVAENMKIHTGISYMVL